MPRPLVLGSGGMTVLFDPFFRIRDLYYPSPGGPNHLAGNSIRFGLFAEDELVWLDDPRVERRMAMGIDGVGRLLFEIPHLHIRGEGEAVLDDENDLVSIFWTLHDRSGSHRRLDWFETENLSIGETDIGDTALFHAASGRIVHFKGGLGFLFGGAGEFGTIRQFACGISGFGGAEGTWRDAEDGKLSMNPIAQGSVDATFSVSLELPPHGSASISTSIKGMEQPFLPVDTIARWKRPAHATCRARAHKRSLELAGPIRDALQGLPEDWIAFGIQCGHVLSAHCHSNGAIVAALDSDILATNRAHYAYCWMRDGARIVDVLRQAGVHAKTEPFLDYCRRCLDPALGYFLQKYTVEGHFGATWHPWTGSRPPLQADETASVVALAANAVLDGSVDERFVDQLVEPCAQFLAGFFDPAGRPLPCFDLWEERMGIHAYTVAATWEALAAAAKLAEAMGIADRGDFYAQAAQRCATFLANELCPEGQLVRGIDAAGRIDATPDSSVLAALLAAWDSFPAAVRTGTIRAIREALHVGWDGAGIARYAGDYYFRQSDSVPGNPWIIATMWLAQAEWRAFGVDPAPSLQWAMSLGGETGVLAEQYHPGSGEPLSVSPLPWSHAETLRTLLLAAQHGPVS